MDRAYTCSVFRAVWCHQKANDGQSSDRNVCRDGLTHTAFDYLSCLEPLRRSENFFGGGAVNVALAVFAGVVTVVPLLLYHAGNRALPISIASLLFYINPTTQLVVGLVYFDLVAAPKEWLVFVLIWSGLALYFTSRRTGASVNHAR